MPYDIMLSNIKLGEDGGRGDVWSEGICPPKSPLTHDGALLSWRWLNTCLLVGSRERIPHFALLVCTASALPIEPSLSQPTGFLTFNLLFLSPIPPGGSE